MDFLKHKTVREPTRRAMATGTCLLMGSVARPPPRTTTCGMHQAPHFQRDSTCSTRCAHRGTLERNSSIFLAQKLEIRAAAIAKTCSSPEFSLIHVYRYCPQDRAGTDVQTHRNATKAPLTGNRSTKPPATRAPRGGKMAHLKGLKALGGDVVQNSLPKKSVHGNCSLEAKARS